MTEQEERWQEYLADVEYSFNEWMTITENIIQFDCAAFANVIRDIWGKLRELCPNLLPPMAGLNPFVNEPRYSFEWSWEHLYFQVEIYTNGSFDWFYKNRISGTFAGSEDPLNEFTEEFKSYVRLVEMNSKDWLENWQPVRFVVRVNTIPLYYLNRDAKGWFAYIRESAVIFDASEEAAQAARAAGYVDFQVMRWT